LSGRAVPKEIHKITVIPKKTKDKKKINHFFDKRQTKTKKRGVLIRKG
jgi:hypothetical protein